MRLPNAAMSAFRSIVLAFRGFHSDGISRGRCVTHDGAHSPKEKQPYIVREVRSDMLRPHPSLKKGPRYLWTVMLGMADSRTGELRHNKHWYTGEEIDLRAEICHRLRKAYIQDLCAAGYVHWERPHVRRPIRGRLRCVKGPTHYFVFRTPRKQGVSSTVTSGNRSRKLPTILSLLHQSKDSKPPAQDRRGCNRFSPDEAKHKEARDRANIAARDVRLLREEKARVDARAGAFDPTRIANVDDDTVEDLKKRYPDLAEEIFGKTPGGVA